MTSTLTETERGMNPAPSSPMKPPLVYSPEFLAAEKAALLEEVRTIPRFVDHREHHAAGGNVGKYYKETPMPYTYGNYSTLSRELYLGRADY